MTEHWHVYTCARDMPPCNADIEPSAMPMQARAMALEPPATHPLTPKARPLQRRKYELFVAAECVFFLQKTHLKRGHRRYPEGAAVVSDGKVGERFVFL